MIPIADSDAWTLAEGKFREKPTLLRYRPNLKNFLGHSNYPRRLTIIWEYEEKEGRDGLPCDDQSDEMREFEDALIAVLDSDRIAILAFIFTHDGNREWNFYIGDVQVVGEKINEALADKPGLPISLEVEDDSEWTEMAKVLQDCEPSDESKS